MKKFSILCLALMACAMAFRILKQPRCWTYESNTKKVKAVVGYLKMALLKRVCRDLLCHLSVINAMLSIKTVMEVSILSKTFSINLLRTSYMVYIHKVIMSVHVMFSMSIFNDIMLQQNQCLYIMFSMSIFNYIMLKQNHCVYIMFSMSIFNYIMLQQNQCLYIMLSMSIFNDVMLQQNQYLFFRLVYFI